MFIVYSMKTLILLFGFLSFIATVPNAFAQDDSWRFSYGAQAGSNSVQGFHYTFYGQVATKIDDYLRGGLSAYISAGEKPSHDREWGVGPFLSMGTALTSFMGVSARQEINYMDVYDPYLVSTNPNVYDHTVETGFASATSVGVNFWAGNLGLSFGYKLIVALTNSALDDGRSGPYLGVGLSF